MTIPYDLLAADELRDRLAEAEEQAELARHIDNTQRMLREREHWLAIAAVIRAELDQRQADWKAEWP